MPGQFISVSAVVNAPIERVWDAFTQPEHIKAWNFASEDWHCPEATNDLRVGGAFSYRMAARDESMAFDFGGVYTDVLKHKRIAYTIGDGRTVDVQFKALNDTQTEVTERFELEGTHSEDQQREGWQAILNEFKRHAESLG